MSEVEEEPLSPLEDDETEPNAELNVTADDSEVSRGSDVPIGEEATRLVQHVLQSFPTNKPVQGPETPDVSGGAAMATSDVSLVGETFEEQAQGAKESLSSKGAQPPGPPAASAQQLKRTPSLEVETGSFSAPESTAVEGSEGDDAPAVSSAPAVPASTSPHARTLEASEDGSVVIHASPREQSDPSPEQEAANPASSVHTVAKDPALRPPLERSLLPDGTEDARKPAEENGLSQDSEDLRGRFRKLTQAKAKSGHVGPSSHGSASRLPESNGSRPGVTSTPPRSPTSQRPQPEQGSAPAKTVSDVPSSNGSKPDASSVAELDPGEGGGPTQDLAEAEARAEVAILAASQRNSSLGKKSVQDLENLDTAPFTEELLQSDDIERTPPPAQTQTPRRPFSPPPGAAHGLTEAPHPEGAFEPPEFRGLVYHDGVDALGRPVVVVNADAVPPKTSRKAACAYMLQRLEPIVVQGPYVLVLVNTGTSSRSNKLPAGWLASSYREMSYPFKKNVKHVILVRPSAALNFMLALMRPLISRKAYVKLKKVDNLSAIAQATNAEVGLQHLGPKFAAAAGRHILAGGEGAARGGYQMPGLG